MTGHTSKQFRLEPFMVDLKGSDFQASFAHFSTELFTLQHPFLETLLILEIHFKGTLRSDKCLLVEVNLSLMVTVLASG